MNNAQIVFPVTDLNESCEFFCNTLGFQILFIYERANRKRIVLVKGPNLCSLCLEQLNDEKEEFSQRPYLEFVVGSNNTFQKLKRTLIDQGINELISEQASSSFEYGSIQIQLANNSFQRKIQSI